MGNRAAGEQRPRRNVDVCLYISIMWIYTSGDDNKLINYDAVRSFAPEGVGERSAARSNEKPPRARGGRYNMKVVGEYYNTLYYRYQTIIIIYIIILFNNTFSAAAVQLML